VGLGLIDRTVIVLCGGKGTRSANPSLPKALQEVNGKSLISRQLAALSPNARYEIIFVAGWNAEILTPEIEHEMTKYPEVTWKCIVEEDPQGTSKAIQDVIPEISAEEVMILLGDLYINAELGRYFDIWKSLTSDILLVAHPNNHPQDSDLVSYDISSLSVKKLLSKKRIPSKLDGNMALAGITLVKLEVLKSISYDEIDLVDSILLHKTSNWDVKIFPTIDIVMDVGNLERLTEVGKIDLNKTKSFFSALLMDLDGTLMHNQEIKNIATELVFDYRILKFLKILVHRNIPIFMVTNQPGIAKNFFTWEDFDIFRTQLESHLAQHSIKIARWYVCPHHPDTGFEDEVVELKIRCSCRKPEIKFADDINNLYKVDLSKAFMLGDSTADAEFAKKAGINFQKVTLDCNLSDTETLTTWQALKLVVEKS
jgi:mannose-1-phosphate guanylyltransferase / phosphomannomutase